MCEETMVMLLFPFQKETTEQILSILVFLKYSK